MNLLWVIRSINTFDCEYDFIDLINNLNSPVEAEQQLISECALHSVPTAPHDLDTPKSPWPRSRHAESVHPVNLEILEVKFSLNIR